MAGGQARNRRAQPRIALVAPTIRSADSQSSTQLPDSSAAPGARQPLGAPQMRAAQSATCVEETPIGRLKRPVCHWLTSASLNCDTA
jgi:hypothetical protein